MQAKSIGLTRLLFAKRSHDDDALLVARCRSGERAAFQLLLELYRDRVVNLAHSLLYSHDDAEDAAQDVFAAAFAALDSFRGEAQLWTWLYRITINTCLHRRRRAKPFGSDEGNEEMDGESTDIQARVLEKMAVENALDELTPRLRIVLVLREMHDLSYDEIAATLQIPVGTVRSRLAEARKQFKRVWETSEAAPPEAGRPEGA